MVKVSNDFIEGIKKEILSDKFKAELIDACRYDLITNLVPAISKQMMKELMGTDEGYEFDVDSCDYVSDGLGEFDSNANTNIKDDWISNDEWDDLK